MELGLRAVIVAAGVEYFFKPTTGPAFPVTRITISDGVLCSTVFERLGAKMAQQFVKAKIKGDKVVLFIKPSCPYCTMAEDVFSKYKFKPGHLESIDISVRSDMDVLQDYFLDLTGARTVNGL